MTDHPAPPTLAYVPFVDGLRAFAVAAVVGYHAGLPVPGGFVGVDIFFVISGYLIIGQITAAIEQRRFSLVDFLARRAIRIFPGYVVVLLTTLAIGSLVLVTPQEFIELGREAVWSAAMLANHYFLSQAGYFDAAAETKPLLHLWSLAVEEQFYVVAPIVLIIGSLVPRHLKRVRIATIAAAALLGIVSFILCARFSGGETNYSFYLMPLRAWEFMAGGFIPLFVATLRKLPRLLSHILVWACAAGLLATIFVFSAEMTFPSYAAAVPVACTAVLIAAGLLAPGIIVQGLEWGPVRYVGRISYALYLWHWPLLTLGRIWNFDERYPPTDAGMVALSLILAIGTYHLIEKPLHRHRHEIVRRLRWRSILSGMGALAVAGIAGLSFSGPVAASVASSVDSKLLPPAVTPYPACVMDRIKTIDTCQRALSAKSLVVLVGDSHAFTLSRGLEDWAADRDAALLTIGLSGCSAYIPQSKSGCNRRQQHALKLIRSIDRPIEAAVLNSQWQFHTGGGTAEQRRERFELRLGATIQTLRELGAKRILVIAPIPLLKKRAPPCVVRALKVDASIDEHCGRTRPAVDAERDDIVEWMADIDQAAPDVAMYDPVEALCDSKTCKVYDGQGVLYRDHSHLSAAGLERVIGSAARELDWLFGQP